MHDRHAKDKHPELRWPQEPGGDEHETEAEGLRRDVGQEKAPPPRQDAASNYVLFGLLFVFH
jgi:hypothetical protein